MQLLDVTNPYWCADPRVSEHAVKTMRDKLADGFDSCPHMPLPVLTPEGAAPERARSALLFALPLPYLPAAVWCRLPGEHWPAYQTRLTLFMDRTGLLDDSRVWYAPLDLDDDGVRAMRLAFDGVGDDKALRDMRAAFDRLLADAWPDGYDAADESRRAAALSAACLEGSAVLAGASALALLEAGETDAARDLMECAARRYGDLFAPGQRTPDTLRGWVADNRMSAVEMVRLLADLGLEDADSVQAVGEALS